MPPDPPLAPFVATRAARAMVTTVDGLASEAGVAMARAGGTAVDAAVAANAVLAVTSQQSCGMGGDLFALVHESGRAPAALDASGRAGSGADAARLRADGHDRMPFRGDIRSVTVPGCVDGWCALHARHGRLPLATVLAPAIEYARDGFPATPMLARAVPLLAGLPERDDYPADLAPGQRVRRPGVARALEAIAADGRDGWYAGEFARELVALGSGEFTDDDLRAPHADWVTPLSVRAWGHDLWTVPPAAQGYVTISAAWIAAAVGTPGDPDDPGWPHVIVEAIKQAAHDRVAVLHEHAEGAALVAETRLAPRASRIDRAHAAPLDAPATPGGTIHLNAVVDGMTVSLTQSNCAGFGAHIAVPDVRVFLQNRGTGFSLTPGHPAEYGPRRRPPHTLCPTLVTTPDGRARFALGTMGADNQPITILQLLARLLANGGDPAGAVAAGRVALAAPTDEAFALWHEPNRVRVLVEGHAPAPWADGLRARGHAVEVIAPFSGATGHAHVVAVDGPGSTLAGAADPRALGSAAAGC